MSNKTQIVPRLTLGVSALVLAAAGYTVAGHYFPKEVNKSTLITKQTSTAPPSAPKNMVIGRSVDFSDIVEQYGPAVVNISVTGKTKGSQPSMPDLDEEDPLFEFFKHFGQQPGQKKTPQIVRGQGSGFILTSDGVILTNAHVIDGADEVIVKLTDRREFGAKIVGIDKNTDIAVLRINARDLPVVALGDASASRVGEPVLAIGSPFGFESSASAGIISAKARSLPDDTYVPFIQTDVAVNPGNSGGPLFNHKGEVIGINSQIYSRTGGFQGVSFAIPINVAVRIKDQLLAFGKVTRGRLGITIQPVTGQLAEAFGLDKAHGALVAGVDKTGPAATAGLQPGDIIVTVNDTKINESGELPAYVGDVKPGSKVKLGVIRNGKRLTLVSEVAEMKDVVAPAAKEKPNTSKRLGVAVRPLTSVESRQFGISSGLFVQDVAGAAAAAGIQTGDIILSVNGTVIKTTDQLGAILEKSSRQVAVLVQRADVRIFIPVRLD